MNSFLLYTEECSSAQNDFASGEAILSGKRFLEFNEKCGTELCEIAICLYGVGHGEAQVTQRSDTHVELRFRISGRRERFANRLIVGLSRPQTIKKVLHVAATNHVSDLHFVPSRRGQASYAQSKSLKEENIAAELGLGLEQAHDGIAPSVHQHGSVSALLKELLETSFFEESQKLYVNAHASASIAEQSFEGPSEHCILVIGPEAGWAASEEQQFLEAGFKAVVLGSRVMRVEVAATFALGAIHVLRTQSRLASEAANP